MIQKERGEDKNHHEKACQEFIDDRNRTKDPQRKEEIKDEIF